ncbi:hypothetical protein [Corallococcus llansteffanensis]|uniref:Uncharacterized protein n=1 Tax=Corallococcus llansteffanensis TaxID=2316731 RepID=A0A3A8PLB0_9BACT|nr:hypothetical protein [Corallococcus llansteffanensis]RKH53312.1 hypothetical protein D7V93_26980 [Corallococcus llansteffanensis]
MRLWIAIVAGLSLGQSQDVAPTPPEDPSVRDPAAAALQDAYEDAAGNLDGARPPQGYVIQGQTDPTQGAYTITPLLPDGTAPLTTGEAATQESQTVVVPPVPTVYDSQPSSSGTAAADDTAGQEASGTGGAGAAGTPSTVGGTTAGQSDTGAGAAGTAPGSGPTNTGAAGVGGTVDTGATSASPASEVAPGVTGNVPLDSSQVTVQEPAPGAAPTTETATGGSGATGTSGTAAPPPGGVSSATAPDQATQAATAGPPNANAAQPAASNEELTRLRERVAELEQEMEARDAVATERSQAVQSQVDEHEQRAYETERARQQRLARIQSAGQWMLAADQALEQGELGVDNALGIADQDFSVVRESASAAGNGMVVVHSERARAQIALARDAASNRDVYGARIALQNAGEELRLARAATLERPGSANALLNR